VLVTIGDLVEDVVVHLGGPINVASDTDVVVTRRRGGSAANMAATTARLGHLARFVGQVGDDGTGETVVAALRAEGVDVRVQRGGRTGTIVCLVDTTGERTMLADRGACVDLGPLDPTWLDDAHTVHVPFYSLSTGTLAATTIALIGLAHERGVRVSLDASSVGVMAAMGHHAVVELVRFVRPDVVLCNEDEADFLGESCWPEELAAGLVIVKRGAEPASVRRADRSEVEVAAHRIGTVDDTTGAGDAFAAGFLVACSQGAEPEDAVAGGHSSAATLLTTPR
jgi:sugar/nucleoside kinase (ribokinase family)